MARTTRMQFLGANAPVDFSWEYRGEIHLGALDAFGAAVCRKCVALDPETFQDARVRCEWLGKGEAPEGVPWQKVKVDWTWQDAPAPVPENATEEQKRDAETARQQANHGLAKRYLLEESAGDALEHDRLLLIGSLFHADAVERGLGLLRAYFVRQPHDLDLRHVWRLCSFWAASEETQAGSESRPVSDKQAHDAVLAAAAILHHDDKEAPKLAPQFIVGRSAHEVAVITGWEDSVAIAAGGVLANIYEAHSRRYEGREGVMAEEDRHSVFSFDYVPRGREAQVGHEAESLRHPFALIGGYLIASQRERICESAAALFAAQSCEWLAEQPPAGENLGPAVEANDKAMADALEMAINRVWDRFGERLKQAGLPKSAQTGELPDRLRESVAWPRLLKQWRVQFTQNLAWDRGEFVKDHDAPEPVMVMKDRPLEEWDQHLQEWEGITTYFFEDCREGYERDFVPLVLRALDASVREELNAQLAREFFTHGSQRLMPNVFARRLVARLHDKLHEWQKQEEELHQKQLREDPMDDAMIQTAPSLINKHLQELKKAIRAVPGVLAALVAGLLIGGVAMLLPVLLPDWFIWMHEKIRDLLGVTWITERTLTLTAVFSLAALVPFYVVWRTASCDRLRLALKTWREAVLHYQDLRLKRSAWELRTQVFRVLLGYGRWLMQPQRRGLHASLTESGLAAEFLKTDELFSESNALHAWLHDGPEAYRARAKSLRDWAAEQLAASRSAPRVMNLPVIRGANLLDALHGWMLNRKWQPSEAQKQVKDWLAWWKALVEPASALAAPWLTRANAKAPWTGSLETPPAPPTDKDDCARTPHSPLMKFAELLMNDEARHVSLDELMNEQLIKAETHTLRDEARAAITSLCLPPAPGGREAQMCVVSAPQSALSAGLGLPNEARYEVPGLPYCAVVSVVTNVPAELIASGFDAKAQPSTSPTA